MNRAPVADAGAPWQLEPPPASARAWLAGLALVLPVLVTAIALGVAAAGGTPLPRLAGSTSLGTAGLLLGVALLGVVIVLVIGRAMQRHHVVLDADGIEVATTFHRRRVAHGQLDLAHARVANLDEHTALRPLFKRNGMAIPGFRSGWFHLRNRQRTLVAMNRGPRVAYIPTTDGFALMLQARQPQALLDRLRDAAPRTPRR